MKRIEKKAADALLDVREHRQPHEPSAERALAKAGIEAGANKLVVVITSHRSAERNGGGRAYLARLEPSIRGSVNRVFVRAKKDGDNRRILISAAQPGDVFEARRWRWNGLRQQYEGGTVWFGIQADGSVCMLTREEAFRAVGATAIATSHRPVVPDHRRPTRMVPDDIVCYSTDADGDSDCPLIDGSAPCLLR